MKNLKAQFREYTKHLSRKEKEELNTLLIMIPKNRPTPSLITIRSALNEYKSNFKSQLFNSKGICEYCFYGSSMYSDLFNYWKFSSGSTSYPVYSFPESIDVKRLTKDEIRNRAIHQFNGSYSNPYNKGAYGRRRLQLVNFLICMVSTMIELAEK